MGATFLTRCAQPGGSISAIHRQRPKLASGPPRHALRQRPTTPIGGYVQIPCIERNAMGAVKAYNAFLLATAGSSIKPAISPDAVIKSTKAPGRAVSTKYKETAETGLALSATEC